MSPPAQNDKTFLDLIERNRPKILKICRVYTWTREDRDDLYQEILCQIWRALPTLKEDVFASTWLYRIALNTAIGFVRKDKARRSRIAPGRGESFDDLPDRGPTRDPETEEQLCLLFKAIARLNEMEKAVITLFLENLSYAEIAKVTGLGESNVGVLLHRAKQKLSTLMKEAECTTRH